MTSPVEPFWLPVQDIRLKPNLPCGMDYMLIGAIAHTVRTTHHLVEPVLVKQDVPAGGWLLLDGRHRWVGHLVAGRAEIRCVEER